LGTANLPVTLLVTQFPPGVAIAGLLAKNGATYMPRGYTTLRDREIEKEWDGWTEGRTEDETAWGSKMR